MSVPNHNSDPNANPKMMLEGESDIERNTVNQQQNIEQNVVFNRRIYFMIGFTCVFNFICSLNCDYRTQQYLVVNSIIYMLFTAYIIRKQMNIELFTGIYLITIGVIYVLTSFVQWITIACKDRCPVCSDCPTLEPTFSPSTNSTR